MIHRIACILSLALGAVIAPRAQAEGVADAFDDFVAASIALSEALFYGAEFEEAEKFLQLARSPLSVAWESSKASMLRSSKLSALEGSTAPSWSSSFRRPTRRNPRRVEAARSGSGAASGRGLV